MGVRIALQGTPVSFGIEPFILGGRTLCHVRPLAEAMGATVSWDDNSQSVSFTRGDRTAQCQVGSDVAVVNGVGYVLDEPPVFVGQNVIVPVRFVAEALNYQVEWHQAQLLVNLVPL